MLRQVYIIKDGNFLYERNYGKVISKKDFQIFFKAIKENALFQFKTGASNYVYIKYNITYIFERKFNLFFVYFTDLTDEFKYTEIELKNLRKSFFKLFPDLSVKPIDISNLEDLNPVMDKIHRNLRPKISLIGFSGVGKTTITKLINEKDIPMEHVPTITGERATLKIDNLEFHLWDFAGQEQFSYLWRNFIQGSNVVFLITDSTQENIEKSRFFIELMRQEAPDAHGAIIANKQDLPDALHPEQIEDILGLKTYAMVAINVRNQIRMIQIIADVLEINTAMSPLLKPLFEKDLLLMDSQRAFERGDYDKASDYFKQISDICLELGDETLGREFSEKAQKLKEAVHQSISECTALESGNSVSEMETPITKVETQSDDLEKKVSEVETPATKIEIPVTKMETQSKELEKLIIEVEIPATEVKTSVVKVETQSNELEQLLMEVEMKSNELDKLISELEAPTTKVETKKLVSESEKLKE